MSTCISIAELNPVFIIEDLGKIADGSPRAYYKRMGDMHTIHINSNGGRISECATDIVHEMSHLGQTLDSQSQPLSLSSRDAFAEEYYFKVEAPAYFSEICYEAERKVAGIPLLRLKNQVQHQPVKRGTEVLLWSRGTVN